MNSSLSGIKFYFINKKNQFLLDEIYLENWENKIGGKLPSDYRSFLLKFGVIGFEQTPRIDTPGVFYKRIAYLDVLFGFTKDSMYDLDSLTFDIYSGRIPDETIPIGQDSSNDLFLISFIGENRGKIWLWDHEHRELTKSELERIYVELSDSKIDTNQLDIDSMIWHWERLPNSDFSYQVGFRNVYLVANSFNEFLESFKIT